MAENIPYRHTAFADGITRTISTEEDAARRAPQLPHEDRNGKIAVDIETRGLGLHSYSVTVIIVATDMHAAILDPRDERHRAAARDAMASARTILFHSSPFDVPPLYSIGAMRYQDIRKVVDTLVLARQGISSDRGGHRLDDLEARFMNTEGETRKSVLKAVAKARKWRQSDVYARLNYEDRVYQLYAGWDGLITHALYEPLLHRAVNQYTDHRFGIYGADIHQALHLIGREQRVNRVFLERSARGLAVNMDELWQETTRLATARDQAARTLTEDYAMRAATSRVDLAAVLADSLPANYPRTEKTGAPSTAAAHLAQLDHPAARAFIQHDDMRRLSTYLESTYAIADANGGVLRPRVQVHAAITGRSSYSEPPTQQFTVPAREMIREDPGKGMVSLDWSQQEPVILAYLSHDTDALTAYETGDGDLYEVAASAAGIIRKESKTITLAKIYGQGLDKLARQLDTDTETARSTQRSVASAMPGTDRISRWAIEWARETGQTFTLSGRIINVDPDAPYRGTNYLVQGSAYDMTAEAIVALDDAGLAEDFYLSMHDELLVTREAAPEVQRMMSTPSERFIALAGRVPQLRVDSADLGDRWRDPDAH